MDLAIAHLVEPRFGEGGERGSLSAKQWNYLVARCRDLKERVLGEAEEGETREAAYPVSVPGAGSGLIAGTLSAEVGRSEILSLSWGCRMRLTARSRGISRLSLKGGLR